MPMCVVRYAEVAGTAVLAGRARWRRSEIHSIWTMSILNLLAFHSHQHCIAQLIILPPAQTHTMLSSVLSFVGWSYLPHLATSKLLPVLHRFYPSLTGRPAPPPNTPLYARHYRYVYAITVISYLFYNFRQAALSMPPNYYEMLGVEPTADENALKSAFNQLARR